MNRKTKFAGYDWYQFFMKRHPELTLRKAQGVFISRGGGDVVICQQEVDKYFALLLRICQEECYLLNLRRFTIWMNVNTNYLLFSLIVFPLCFITGIREY
jgi:hypothetical protein